MKMRNNVVGYVKFLYLFAPCVVGKKKWERGASMVRVVDEGKKLEELFSVTDEAFLLLCMYNYSQRWVEEFYRDARHSNVVVSLQVSCIHC